MTATRANAWNNGGTFANEDLLWYARGVGAMQRRSLDDPASWWFFAAIHGEELALNEFPGWAFLPGPPAPPTSPRPPVSIQDRFWNQCQHRTWYFLPWHRGYLIALEAQVRAEVVALGGPSTWALPYWDPLIPGQSTIPPAFTQAQLPDGSDNALFVTARYGPQGNGNIFVPSPPVSEAAMSNDVFTGISPQTPPPGFGGPVTGFWHTGGGTSGNLENNPHNMVHGIVGGPAPARDGTYGLMADPGLAALDPIFYVHHANVDRMWAAWNADGNLNPSDPNWLSGPASTGEREFVAPLGGRDWVYTPEEMSSLEGLEYTYDDLPQPAPAAPLLTERLTRLGGAGAAAAGAGTQGRTVELLGASEEPLPIKGLGAGTTVRLDTAVRGRLSASLESVADTAAPDRVFLRLENVRGTHDAAVLDVYLNVPEGDDPRNHPDRLAGSLSLFGLRLASAADGTHGGSGLNLSLEVSQIIDSLHIDQSLAVDALDVRITPNDNQALPEAAEITVGRVSLYRQGS